MKKIIATSALALTTLAGAASAMTPQDSAVNDALRIYAPGVEASELTAADANLILSVVHSGDSEGDKRTVIQSIAR